MVAQAVVDLGRSRLLFSQFIHRRVRKIAFAIQYAVVCQHQAIAEYVMSGGEQAASRFGKPMHTVTERCGQEPNGASGVSVLFLVWTVSGGQPGNLRFIGPKRCLSHPER